MHAERVSALSPGNFGVEQAQRPTATGSIQILNEGQQPLYPIFESFRRALAELALHMLARYKQHYPEGLEVWIRAAGVDPFSETVQLPDKPADEVAFIETRASSASVNKEVRKQEKLAWLDKVPQLYQVIEQLTTMATSGAPSAPVAVKLLSGFHSIFKDVLDEMEVPNAEQINPDLSQEVSIGQAVNQMVAQAMQAINQMGGQLQGPGGPGGGPPEAGPPPGEQPDAGIGGMAQPPA